MTLVPLRTQLLCGALLWLSLALAGLAYSPGLSGMFFVDDYQNLNGLSAITENPSPEAYLAFAATGFAGDFGRPLALATFALQHASWPGSAGDFIYVNILLHLFNACLLFAVLLRVFALAPPRPPASGPLLALAATALWLFAPLQSGAVLYVVQRMAQLSTTFMLLGLLAYLHGRARELAGRPLPGMVGMAAGGGIGLGLGVLAKENAALFPFMVLALEYTLLHALLRSRAWRAMSALTHWAPALLLVAVIALRMPAIIEYSGVIRDFSVGERLLTEGRVLFMYLQKFLLPTLYGIHLYYDDYTVSRSLLSPWTTAPALLAWIAAVVAAIRLRTRAPALAFAILWFLAAHLLESTVLPLELAFDHRNYLALAGPAVGLAWYGARLLQAPRAQRLRPLLLAGIAGYLGFCVVSLWQTAAFWGQPWELAQYWAQQQPASRRAQTGAAKFYWQARQPQRAVETYERALQRWPGDVSLFFGILEIGCAFPNHPMPDLARIAPIMAAFSSTAPAAVGMLDNLVTETEMGLCKRWSPAELWLMSEMTFEAPRLAEQEPNHLLLKARIAALAQDWPVARQNLDASVRMAPFGLGLKLATAWAVQAGDTRCARDYLARLREGPGISPAERWSYHKDIEMFDAAIARLPATAHSELACAA